MEDTGGGGEWKEVAETKGSADKELWEFLRKIGQGVRRGVTWWFTLHYITLVITLHWSLHYIALIIFEEVVRNVKKKINCHLGYMKFLLISKLLLLHCYSLQKASVHQDQVCVSKIIAKFIKKTVFRSSLGLDIYIYRYGDALDPSSQLVCLMKPPLVQNTFSTT